MLRQHDFDFAELDAETANFDLVVETPEEIDVAIRQIAPLISGLVQACPRLVAEGIGNKPLSGESGVGEIPACDAAPPICNSPGTPIATGCPLVSRM
jgi:hypothetical protein